MADEKYLTPEETMSKLNDPKVKETLRYWASSFEEKFRGNWFTIAQVAKKFFQKDVHKAQEVSDVIVLGGFAYRENRDGIIKYKITLNPEDKVILLQQQLTALDQQREAILKEIERLSSTNV